MTIKQIATGKVGTSVYLARRAVEIDRLAAMKRGFWAQMIVPRVTFPRFGAFEV